MSFLAALQEAIKDRYRVEEELGRGAMAIVFRGHDLRHNRAVAIKLLRPELSDVVGSERFLREIQVAARLQHSHIVPLFDSGASRGFVYLVMPLLTGESLRARLDGEGPLHADEALRLTLQVGDALQYAHRKGVIHRDVKPENILLHEGNALIADFGVALALTGGEDQRITAAGLVVGTPAYMSPEQATGAAVDGRSDLYSLGCVLYEMLTDELPHGGITTPEVIARKLTELPRSVRDLRKNTPVHVAAAVERALARLAADRFDSVGEFVQALKGHGPARKAPRLRLRFPTSAIGLMVIAAVFGGYAWITRTRATERKPLDPLLVTASPLGTDGQHGLESVGLALLELVDGQLPGPPGLRLSLVTSRGRGLWGDSARFGPGRRLTGTLREGPDGLTVRFELEDLIRVRSLGQATATGPRDSLAALARVLAVKLLQLETARGDPAALAVLPRSLLALSALNSGIGYYRLARYQSAVESFNSAIEADSTLAIAGLWLIMAGRRYGSGPLGMQEYAWTHRGGLAPRDQAVLRGFLGSRFPISFTHREWLENLEAAVAAVPDRPELWFELGDFLKWNGAYLGLPDALE
ncbi:MAG TPA: serine/threonine-protein kinase, partial [Gemmatimonadales bacterium]|nr:serine/threonine-protein kinase [Gemmatimonadales bacterium]